METLLAIVSIQSLNYFARRLIWQNIPREQHYELCQLLPEELKDSTLNAIFLDADLNTLDLLLPNRANSIYFFTDALVEDNEEQGEEEFIQDSLLNIAIINERSDLIDLLLRYGADPNMEVEEYPLDYAIINRNLQIINTLLYAGSDPNLGNIMSNAILTFDLDIVKIMVAHGGIISENNIQYILRYAMNNDSRELSIPIIDFLLNAGVNLSNSDYQYIDSIVTMYYPIDIIKLFLDRGADPNIVVGRRNNTPVNKALDAQRFDVVLLLLQYGAIVNNPDSYLCSAYRNKAPEVFIYLLQQGGNPYKADLYGASVCSEVSRDPIYANFISQYSKY